MQSTFEGVLHCFKKYIDDKKDKRMRELLWGKGNAFKAGRISSTEGSKVCVLLRARAWRCGHPLRYLKDVSKPIWYQELGNVGRIFLTHLYQLEGLSLDCGEGHIGSFGSSDNSNYMLIKQQNGFLLFIKRMNSQSPPTFSPQIRENQVSGPAVVKGGHSNGHRSR